MIKNILILILLNFQATAQEILPGDLIINEVLFNPIREGFDYIEAYNRSSKTVNLQEILIANRNVTGDISAERSLSGEPLLLPPASYFVITANERWLRQHYVLPENVIICQISSLPSYPDDEGTVILVHRQRHIIDELKYSEKWHFALIAETEGVALERINYDAPTQDKNNWTSASSSSGFGTPGFQNSHFRADLQAEGEVSIFPKLISPNNDGFDDFATISFKSPQPGFLARSIIYDIAGRRIKYLLKNELLGTNSTFTWRGEDDNLSMTPSGIYLVVTEVFNLEGKTNKYRNSIIVHGNSR